ncbi:hypothetical protein H5410_033075 [Solanum commersonii]|uniref:Uncharacterized protein n=1 Tax=Solanum commersonii TaxID=4109 RepID=A0A9J5YMR5_SOLCO|nr:hypothetical protein H5410_033075 [Solanum commersonii]
MRDKVGVASIEDKMRKARSLWFGHVKWRCSSAKLGELGYGWFQERLAKLKNKAHTCVVTLQCKNKCLLDPGASLHSKHLAAMLMPLFCNASCVKQALLATIQTKHFTLVGATRFQTALHGPVFLPPVPDRPHLYNLLTENLPSRSKRIEKPGTGYKVHDLWH